MKKLATIIIFSLILLSWSFTWKKVKPEGFYASYKSRVSECMRQQQVDEYSYNLLYRPFQVGLINYVKNENPDRDAVKNYIRQNKNHLDFALKLEISSQSSADFLKYAKGELSYEEKLVYYSQAFRDDIKLVLNQKDTLRPDHFIFERSSSSRQSGEFFFSFALDKKPIDVQLIIRDKGFEEKTLIFDYQRDNLYHFPELKHYKKWS